MNRRRVDLARPLFALCVAAFTIFSCMPQQAVSEAHAEPIRGTTILSYADRADGIDGTRMSTTVAISITDVALEPAEVMVAIGTEVIWLNTTLVTQTVQSAILYRAFLPIVFVDGPLLTTTASSAHGASQPRAIGDKRPDFALFSFAIAPGESASFVFADSGTFHYSLAGISQGVVVVSALVAVTPTETPIPTETPTETPTPVPTAISGAYSTGVKFRGINRAGAEYGDDWDGWTGQTYYDIPSPADTAQELAYYALKGMNTLRLPISWERVQHNLGGPLTDSYVTPMMAYIDAATSAGFIVVLDLHNYNRYAVNTHSAGGAQVAGYTQHVLGDGVLDISHLSDVWAKLATLVISNPRVVFGIMNEPHDFSMTSTEWFAGAQTVMNAIRSTGATQLILAPNSRGSDVDHWSTWAPNGGPLDSVAALAITDSADNFAFDMHAYQDAPTNGASYATLVAGVTNWARTNNRKLFLAEFGSTTNSANGAAGIGGLLSYLNDNNDVWMGWTTWNLPPYALWSGNYTTDGAALAWFTPYLIPNTVSATPGPTMTPVPPGP